MSFLAGKFLGVAHGQLPSSGPPPALGRYVTKIVRSGTSPKQRIFAVAWGCLRVANFLELRQREVRRVYLPRTPVNKLPVNAPHPSGWHHGCWRRTAE